jgi:hypothetical protein
MPEPGGRSQGSYRWANAGAELAGREFAARDPAAHGLLARATVADDVGDGQELPGIGNLAVSNMCFRQVASPLVLRNLMVGAFSGSGERWARETLGPKHALRPHYHVRHDLAHQQFHRFRIHRTDLKHEVPCADVDQRLVVRDHLLRVAGSVALPPGGAHARKYVAGS